MVQKIDTGDGVFHFYNSGMPVGNQAHYYRQAKLPSQFDIPTSWIEDGGDLQSSYELEQTGDYSVGGQNFINCLRVDYISQESSDYLSGQGSYIISPEVGIIEIVFDRIDGSTACFEYIENEQFTQKFKLSGKVVDSGGAPK